MANAPSDHTPKLSAESASHSRGKLRSVLLPVALIVLAAFGASLGMRFWLSKHGSANSAHGPAPGAPIEDLVIPRHGGGSLRLSDTQAKVLMINFWATWCEACLVEMPSIVQLYKEYHPRGFEVIAISLDENPALIAPMAQKLGMLFPIGLDPEGQLVEVFDVHGIPFTVLLDQNRRVLMAHQGEKDWYSGKMRQQLEQWLKSAEESKQSDNTSR